MHKQIYQKVFIHLCLLMIALSVLAGFYDVIFGSIWEVCHLVLEMIEMMLDDIIEELFDTKLHVTQMIVFYIMVLIGGALIYVVWKIATLGAYLFGQEASTDWEQFKFAASSDWRMLTPLQKIMGILVFLLLNYFVSFLFF